MMRLVSSNQRVMSCCSDSGSSRSPSAVKPLTSENRTVTILRAVVGAGVGESELPQRAQNVAPSLFDSPHRAHARMMQV
jgi:hypothetical protein